MQNVFGLFVPNATEYHDNSYTLGLKFHTDAAGTINGLRYYNTSDMVGPHPAALYDSDGNTLATVTFSYAILNGWQEAYFSSPVDIQSNLTYIVAVYFPGYYLQGDGFVGIDTQNLHVLTNAGGYAAGSGLAFPTSWGSYNFSVDPIFDTDQTPPLPVPTFATAYNSAKSVNSLSDATIAAISLSIRNAMNNGLFSVDIYYLLTANELLRLPAYLTCLGYTATIEYQNNDIWKISVSWRK